MALNHRFRPLRNLDRRKTTTTIPRASIHRFPIQMDTVEQSPQLDLITIIVTLVKTMELLTRRGGVDSW